MLQDLLSAAVVIGAWRVNIFEVWLYSNLLLLHTLINMTKKSLLLKLTFFLRLYLDKDIL